MASWDQSFSCWIERPICLPNAMHLRGSGYVGGMSAQLSTNGHCFVGDSKEQKARDDPTASAARPRPGRTTYRGKARSGFLQAVLVSMLCYRPSSQTPDSNHRRPEPARPLALTTALPRGRPALHVISMGRRCARDCTEG